MNRHSFPAILSSLALCAAFAGSSLQAQSYGLTTRPIVGPYLDGVMPAEPPVIGSDWSTVEAFPNLSFLNPLGVLPLPGTNKLVVFEREGRIYSFDNNANTSAKTLILDLSNQCQGWDDEGLLAMAFHPNFSTNHYVYVFYNWVTPGTVAGNANTRPPNNTSTHQRLARFTYNTATGLLDPASEYVIIDQIDHNTWHNGGGMFFHPANGFLYLTNGNDANSTHDQTISNAFFGCMLRIDVDKRGGSISHPPIKRANEEVGANWPNAYYVPNDNPFVGVSGALEEIYSLGLRSPHRATVDALTGRIFIGDVGEGSKEEVDTIETSDPGGLNFQWNRIEGYNGDLTPPYLGVNKRPILDYSHSDGQAVIGGYVYRGSAFPELTGKYIFGDNVANKIWYLDESTLTSTTPASKVFLATLPKGPGPNTGTDYTGLGSFGVDANGEIYLCQLSSTAGKIYKLQRGGPPPSQPLPTTLSATGIFSDVATMTPGPKVIPYGLNQPFWSDGALKARWVSVPNIANVGFTPTGEWTWPAGTVLVKHFDLNVDDTNPSARKRLETRLLVKTAASAYGVTYKWRADNSDADLIDNAITENIPITIPGIGALNGQDIGGPAMAGSTNRSGNLVTMTAGGADIWGTSDQFQYAWQQRSGDFDITVRVESLTQPDLYAKTGLMARESLTANSRHVYAMVFPSNAARNNNNGGYEFQYRETTGGGSAAIYPAIPQPQVNYPNTWLRLARQGDTFIGYSSVDGVWWNEFARKTMVLPQTLYFGLATTAHTTAATATAKVHVQDTRMHPWYFPSRSDCMQCHNSASGGVLGPKTRQLNGNLVYPNGVTDNQLRAWAHIGLFDNAPQESQIPGFDALAALNDTTASLEKRSRSFLDANCAQCHRPGGVHAFWDARFDTPLAQQGLLYGTLNNNLGDPFAKVIVPQDLDHSVLYKRVNTVGPIQMPPLARNMIDEEAVDVLKQWIDSIPPNTPPAVSVTAPANNTLVYPNNAVGITATATDGDGIAKVSFYVDGTKVGEDATSPYQGTWVASGFGVHQLMAIAIDNAGNSGSSAPITVMVQDPALPATWAQSDIGAVGVAGSGSFASGTYTVAGGGADIWDTADSFHYVFKTMTGNGQLIARVASLQAVDGWTKGGIMFRESLTAGSRHAFALLSPDYGTVFQRRVTTDGASTSTPGTATANAPYWVKLVRSGNTFTAYSSRNGKSWTQLASDTIPMASTIYVGFAVTAHNNAASATVTFDSVSQ